MFIIEILNNKIWETIKNLIIYTASLLWILNYKIWEAVKQ